MKKYAQQKPQTQQLTPELQRITEARHHNPFSILGKHTEGDSTVVRVYIPGARGVFLCDIDTQMTRIPETDFF